MYSFSLYGAKEELFCCSKWKFPRGLLSWKQEHYPKDIVKRVLCVLGIFLFKMIVIKRGSRKESVSYAE